MAENAVLFLTYGEVKRMLGERPSEGKELSLLQLATAGGVAGGIGAFVIGPFEVIKGKSRQAEQKICPLEQNYSMSVCLIPPIQSLKLT